MFEATDPYLKGVEDFLKLPEGVTSRQLIPEIIARILEIPVDILANDITGAKVAKGIMAVLLGLAPGPINAYTGKKLSDRDVEDLFAIAKEWFIEMTDPTSDDLVKLASAIQNVRLGVANNDPSRVLSVFGAKSLQQIQSDWANVMSAFGTAFGMPSAGSKKPAAPGSGTQAPLYRETLAGPGKGMAAPQTPAPPTQMPGVSLLARFSTDHQQPQAPAVTPRFRLTLSG